MKHGIMRMDHSPQTPPGGMFVFTSQWDRLGSTEPYAEELAEMKAWCQEQFGPPLVRLYQRDSIGWVSMGKHFYFTDPNMATSFRLRWY